MEIVEKCISKGIFLHPDAKQKLEKQENPNQLIEKILETYEFKNPVLQPKHIEKYLKENPNKTHRKTKPTVEKITDDKPNQKPNQKPKQTKNPDKIAKPETENKNNSSGVETSSKDKSGEDSSVETNETGEGGSGESGVVVKRDITGRSECEGELKNFINYFNDRYERIKKEIGKRNGMRNVRPIDSLDTSKDSVSLVGIVNDVRDTSNGHKLILLEDKTGEVPALALKHRSDVYSDSEKVLQDEVIGLKGTTSDNGSDLFILDEIVWPDLPLSTGKPETKGDGYIAFISDVHFGSTTFMDSAWSRFVDWLNGEMGGPEHKKTVQKIKYLCIAGDLVEGIGVYPGQKKELRTVSITEQYKEAAEQLKKIPEHINIIISPGNHDAVRQAEPQPALDEKLQKQFDRDNITFIGNPSTIEIEGVEIIVYHGRSLDDLIAELPNCSYEKPANAMKEFVKRRHLSPIYGKKTPIAPENQDHLFVDKPDIIHCGHVHKFGIDNHKGVQLFNTGTWQKQTKFQKKKGIHPDPGRVVLYNLKNHEPKIVKFCN
ncbi:Archaeal DNA polymerase II small subunit/DNA polymerase delta subunit B [Methanonatronarchaeum thermophilum]|uniref:DNA polymerase II small subunit n=1 Tax=Methanonatronarchaeum thermophilum TaxID=1927129 RepID=A0A1Y3GFH0_9EURY|nr:DNA-directed DNA polymerase II small subunit [Methanonatronarchaeum thermophilum]OUJ18126.1 Archaeal DNA polymerase II small subunit/DNA polymerase delta subunit B [Methanonatronarchaeum thermophilum]